MWHVTCDMWHVTHGPGPWESGPCPLDWRTTIPSNVDLVFFPTILTYVIMLENCQNKILVYGCSPIQGKKFYPGWNLMNPGSQSETYRLNELISDEAVYRTAPATPGLLINTKVWDSYIWSQFTFSPAQNPGWLGQNYIIVWAQCRNIQISAVCFHCWISCFFGNIWHCPSLSPCHPNLNYRSPFYRIVLSTLYMYTFKCI